MPPMSMSDEPMSRAVLAQFHREVALPDLQRAVADEVAGADRHLTTQIERLWDALLGTREKLEIEYQLVRSGIGRLEERLERIERRLDALGPGR
jgi:hypothetical protein